MVLDQGDTDRRRRLKGQLSGTRRWAQKAYRHGGHLYHCSYLRHRITVVREISTGAGRFGPLFKASPAQVSGQKHVAQRRNFVATFDGWNAIQFSASAQVVLQDDVDMRRGPIVTLDG